MTKIKTNSMVDDNFKTKVSNSKSTYYSILSKAKIVSSSTDATITSGVVLGDIEVLVSNTHDIAMMFNTVIIDLAGIMHEAEKLNAEKFSNFEDNE